jgi:pyruvate ferredoxin oxidoreductase delta subunit
MSISSVEIVYRGVLQMRLARRIGRGIVLGARRENKLGFTFGRYGDSPERVGIPAKQFAVIGDSEKELQPFMTPYELDNNDVTAVLDDTLCKGVESWAWHGLQPINKLTKPGGTLLVLSQMSPDDLLELIPMKGAEYNLAVVKGSATWSSMWKYDDDTDARILGAIAKIAPHIISFDSLEHVIIQEWEEEYKITLAHQSFDEVQVRRVLADEGAEQIPYESTQPTWQQMGEALVIPAIPSREQATEGAYQAERNPDYKGMTARTNRPVVDFTKCRKCRLCWLHCPDAGFDIMPDGSYNVNLEYCNGCGICASICPVEDCITMVPELCFPDNASQWEMWQKDNESYAQWVEAVTDKKLTR